MTGYGQSSDFFFKNIYILYAEGMMVLVCPLFSDFKCLKEDEDVR